MKINKFANNKTKLLLLFACIETRWLPEVLPARLSFRPHLQTPGKNSGYFFINGPVFTPPLNGLAISGETFFTATLTA